MLRLYKVDKEKNEEELQASIADGLKMISWMTEYNETVSLFDSDAQVDGMDCLNHHRTDFFVSHAF